MRHDDRALSDVLAFVLIFAVMIASVGLIGAVGFDTVGEVRDSEQLSSAELSMAELSDQLTGIADHESPVRSSELRVGGATVAVTEGVTLTITVSGEGPTTWNETVELGALEYQLGDTTIATVGGAVIRIDDGHGYMLEEPPFLVTEELARLNLLSVGALRDTTSITTEQPIQIQSHHQHTQLLEPSNRSYLYDIETIEIEVEGDGPMVDAWERYFSSHEHWGEDGDGWIAPMNDAGEESSFSQGVIIRRTHIGFHFIR